MKYLDNEDFLKEIKRCFEEDRKTEEIGRMFLLLATKFSEQGKFSGYTWKDDMICEAVLTCLKYMHNFDVTVENPKPFAYFSKIIYHSFINYISKQKTHSFIKDMCYKNLDLIEADLAEKSSLSNVCGIDYQKLGSKKKKKKKKKR